MIATGRQGGSEAATLKFVREFVRLVGKIDEHWAYEKEDVPVEPTVRPQSGPERFSFPRDHWHYYYFNSFFGSY